MNDQKGTIDRWISDAMHILDRRVTEAPAQILVGSSMGAWLMLLLSKERVDRIKGLVGIASGFLTRLSAMTRN
jgi:pimeloyl-ACP methyl ester carboxylesterase